MPCVLCHVCECDSVGVLLVLVRICLGFLFYSFFCAWVCFGLLFLGLSLLLINFVARLDFKNQQCDSQLNYPAIFYIFPQRLQIYLEKINVLHKVVHFSAVFVGCAFNCCCLVGFLLVSMKLTFPTSFFSLFAHEKGSRISLHALIKVNI